MKLIVTGASGWIGRKVATRATSLGFDVIALDAVPPIDGHWVAYRVADIASDDVFSLARDPALLGAVALIHCAGYAHRPIETPAEVRRFHAINRDGTGRVLELAHRVGVGRIVYLSSIAFYDWRRGCDFAEEGPLASPTAYAESKLAGERLCRESGLDWRVARLGTVFGTGDRANFAKLASAMARGRFLVPGRGDARKSVLPVSFAAELLVDLALRESIPHRLVNLALPVAPTLAEICDTYTQLCSFPRAKRIPLGLLRLLAAVGDGVARVRPSCPLTSVNVRKLTTSTTVNTERMMETWPVRSWGTFEEWLAQSADYYRASAQPPRSG
jgi:nucleoside-diphosphate-sugar epimerase